jgi:hypothetical protein
MPRPSKIKLVINSFKRIKEFESKRTLTPLSEELGFKTLKLEIYKEAVKQTVSR